MFQMLRRNGIFKTMWESKECSRLHPKNNVNEIKTTINLSSSNCHIFTWLAIAADMMTICHDLCFPRHGVIVLRCRCSCCCCYSGCSLMGAFHKICIYTHQPHYKAIKNVQQILCAARAKIQFKMTPAIKCTKHEMSGELRVFS